MDSQLSGAANTLKFVTRRLGSRWDCADGDQFERVDEELRYLFVIPARLRFPLTFGPRLSSNQVNSRNKTSAMKTKSKLLQKRMLCGFALLMLGWSLAPVTAAD